MIRDSLLALGVLFSTASQLRPQGAPFGPGELFLAIWILLALGHEVVRRGPPITAAFLRLLIFWLMFACALSLGLIMGLATEDFRDTVSTVHTMLAYALMVLLSGLVAVTPQAGLRLRRVTWMLTAAGAATLTAQIGHAAGFFSLPQISPWEWSRFRGWSENPNQMGLLASVLLLLSVHQAETAERPRERLAALACTMPSFAAGLMTKSDSFMLVALIAGPMFIGLKFWRSLFVADRKLSLAAASACVIVLALPLMLASAAPFAPIVMDRAEKFVTSTMEQNNQAEHRFILWREAADLGLNSWMLGLGPGPHLVEKLYKRPPPAKFEAHNTLFDLLTQGGIIAVLSYLWLISIAFLATYRSGLIALTALVFAIFAFSNFHLIIRHPIFWFSITLCLMARDGVWTGAEARNRSR